MLYFYSVLSQDAPLWYSLLLQILPVSESSTFLEHYSGFPFIHLRSVSFDIFVQEDYHVLSLVFFLNACCMRSYLAQAPAKKKKKKCKTVSLKPSVVHLDLHTVGGTWGLVCCCLKKDVPFTNENTAT